MGIHWKVTFVLNIKEQTRTACSVPKDSCSVLVLKVLVISHHWRTICVSFGATEKYILPTEKVHLVEQFEMQVQWVESTKRVNSSLLEQLREAKVQPLRCSHLFRRAIFLFAEIQNVEILTHR